MAITHVATNTATASGAASLTVPLPAGLQEGDAVLVLAGTDGTANLALSEASGTWEEQESYANDTLDSNLAAFFKLMGATPDTELTVSAASGTPNWAGCSSAWRGVDQTTPHDTAAEIATGTNGSNPNPPQSETVTDNAWMIVGASASEGGAGGGGNPVAPIGYGNFVFVQHSGGNVAVMIADAVIATAAPVATPIFDVPGRDANDCWVAVSYPLRPAAAQSVSADPAAETETAIAIGHSKARTIGLAAETETASTVGHAKARTIGVAAETETAIAIGHSKSRAIGTALEIESAIRIQLPQTIAVGVATETEAAVPITVATAGQAVAPPRGGFGGGQRRIKRQTIEPRGKTLRDLFNRSQPREPSVPPPMAEPTGAPPAATVSIETLAPDFTPLLQGIASLRSALDAQALALAVEADDLEVLMVAV